MKGWLRELMNDMADSRCDLSMPDHKHLFRPFEHVVVSCCILNELTAVFSEMR